MQATTIDSGAGATIPPAYPGHSGAGATTPPTNPGLTADLYALVVYLHKACTSDLFEGEAA